MFVLLTYDEDYYIFETFVGIFSTREKAQEWIDNDYWVCNNEKVPNHGKYVIREIAVDIPYDPIPPVLWED